jgi:hypothetical protein
LPGDKKGDIERVDLKKACQRRRLIVASGILSSQGFVEGFFQELEGLNKLIEDFKS